MKLNHKDYRLIIYIIATLALLFGISRIFMSDTGAYVRIIEDGREVDVYPLNNDIDIKLSHNTVSIKDGRVFMSDADCPDGLCIKQGAISHAGQVIACLPNRVTVQVISGHSGIKSSDQPVIYSGIHFDTLVNVTVNQMSDKDVNISEIIRSECERYELICSRTGSSSELYKLNHGLISDKKSVVIEDKEYLAYKVSDDLYDMISKGADAYRTSDGIFDIAIGSVTELWDFKSGAEIIPDKAKINTALSSVSVDSIKLLEDNYIVITNPDTVIDLGGLAKGYIGDRLRDTLIADGVTSAVISLGGNVVTIGDKSGESYRIGIKKPFSETVKLITTVSSANSCVITSGTYERYFIKDGRLYHHILNPATGYPYDTDISGATVICDSSLTGDILSTVLLAKGADKASEYADKLKQSDIYVILCDNNGEIIYDSRP